jgi:Rrf2 family protein
MLRLSKKADYALMAMKHLALQADRGSSSAREIAQQYDIPVELLAKVLQRLVRRGLLASHQGTRGGYQLARTAGAISIADVIQAIDGPLTMTACSSDDHRCDQYAACSVRDPLWRIKDRIMVALASCTVADLTVEPPETTPVTAGPLGKRGESPFSSAAVHGKR